ncbi:hypothetical protein CPB84DRAFT_1848083 [Gymnopilus junonius]|uniref:Uncharacterized protein n=1 Tax=Gymnopilus junonius TaxID=109634 RepID=A0A9P5NIZ4_GYMJU|nr:hypothetical protein CPB84DRAFT_1848083 [Gymnopilus junonius]
MSYIHSSDLSTPIFYFCISNSSPVAMVKGKAKPPAMLFIAHLNDDSTRAALGNMEGKSHGKTTVISRGTQLPVELIDKMLEDLASDYSQPRKAALHSHEYDSQLRSWLRSPKAFSAVLHECAPEQYILLETYCKNVTELSLKFRSECPWAPRKYEFGQGHEDLYAITADLLIKVTKLSLTFESYDKFLILFDLQRWMEMTGARNVTDLSITFASKRSTLEGVKAALDDLALQPFPIFDIAKIFGPNHLPRLEKRKISLAISMLEWKNYEQHEIAASQSRVDELAQ